MTDAPQQPSPPARDREERKLVTGTVWLGAAQAVVSVGSLASGIVAARVLSKHDFGLMGIALLAINLLDQLSQSGFDKALVQREKAVERYLNVAWTWNALRGLVLAGILCGAAFGLSRFYGEPLLLPVIAVTSIAAVANGLCNVGTVFFARELDFRKLFLIRGIQALTTLGISIPAVLIFRNVWALVVGHVAGALAALVISYLAHPYRPRLEWNPGKLGQLVQYGKWVTVTTAMVFLVTQGDDLFVSKYLGPVSLAVYQLSYQIANLPTTHVTHVLSQSSFPTYARLQGDSERLRAAYLAVMRGVMVFSGAVSALIFVLVPYLPTHVIGEKWAPIVPLVRILVVAGFVRSFLALAGPLFQAAGRTELDFRMNTPRCLVLVLGIWPACAWLDLAGASLLVLLSLVVIVPFWFAGVGEITGLRPGRVVRENALALLSTAWLGASLWTLSLRLGPSLAALGGVIGGGLLAWLAGLALLGKLSTRLDFFGDFARLRSAIKG